MQKSSSKLFYFSSRKADLRELKLLQKIENRQYQDLVLKAQFAREQQEKKFEQDMQVCCKIAQIRCTLEWDFA